MSITKSLLTFSGQLKFTKFSIFLFSILFLASCGSSIKLNSDELAKINPSTAFYFNNYPYLTEQTNYRFSSFLDAFKIVGTPLAEVFMDFTPENELRISYQNERGKLISKTFEGKFKDDYYEIYFQKSRGGLPPIYWFAKIDRMRLAINKEGNLVIYHKYKNGKYYFFGLLFQNVTDDLMIDREIRKNKQQLFFKREEIPASEAERDFRLFL